MSNLPEFRYTNSFSKKNKLARFLWEIVWLTLFKPTPRWSLNGWRLFLLKLFGAKIGKGCRVFPSCRIWAPWNLEMGKYSVLGENVDCYTMSKIKIGNHVSVSQRAFLCAGTHDIRSITLPLVSRPIDIADYVWVCAEAFVGPGCSVGEGSIVAARAVCIKPIGSWLVVAGNPAREINKRQVTEAANKSHEGTGL